MRQELEDIRRDNIDRGLGDDSEERLQIERGCAQRLRSRTAGDEGQIAIHEGVARPGGPFVVVRRVVTLPDLAAWVKAIAVATLAACVPVAAHAVSDEVEGWITGMRGVAATRVAFVRGGRARFRFRGKGGQDHDIVLDDARLKSRCN